MHSQPPPPPPPPPPPADQTWIPPAPAPMDIVNPSEDSNSQDSVEFTNDPHHVFSQNSHGFNSGTEHYPAAPMAVNQFDYQVRLGFIKPVILMLSFELLLRAIDK